MSTIVAGTSSGLQLNSDSTGNLNLQYGTGINGLVINTSGAIGVGSSPSYGTSGQVLVSGGSGAAPTWGSAGVSVGKAAAFAVVL